MKELTAEHKLHMIALLVNGMTESKLSKKAAYETSNLQRCMISNLIDRVGNTDEFYDMLYMFGYVCDMLEQNIGNYRMITDAKWKTGCIPDDALITLPETGGCLYCRISEKLSDREKWDIAVCIRNLIMRVNHWELKNLEGK